MWPQVLYCKEFKPLLFYDNYYFQFKFTYLYVFYIFYYIIYYICIILYYIIYYIYIILYYIIYYVYYTMLYTIYVYYKILYTMYIILYYVLYLYVFYYIICSIIVAYDHGRWVTCISHYFNFCTLVYLVSILQNIFCPCLLDNYISPYIWFLLPSLLTGPSADRFPVDETWEKRAVSGVWCLLLPKEVSIPYIQCYWQGF